MKKDNSILNDNVKLPICLREASVLTLESQIIIYGVPIFSLMTKKHRIVSPSKPISKLFIYH